MQVSPAKLTQLLNLYIPNRWPVLISGAPGIGKSDIVEQAAHDADCDLLISHPVVEDPTDSKGLPFPSEDRSAARFLPFGDLQRALTARRPLVWFLDDLGQASPAVQAAKMQLLLARRIGEHKLPDHVTFVGATNRRVDNAGVSGILDPVLSRFFAVCELVTSLADWTKWAVAKDLPPELIAFLRFRSDLLSVKRTSRDIEPATSPRTWGFVGEVLPKVPLDLQVEAVCSAVGDGPGGELVSFLAIYRALPSIDAILANPDSAPIPDELSVLHATVAALAPRATEANFERVVRYADRLVAANHREFVAYLVRDALQRTPTLQNTHAFIRAQGGEIGKIIQGE